MEPQQLLMQQKEEDFTPLPKAFICLRGGGVCSPPRLTRRIGTICGGPSIVGGFQAPTPAL